MNKNYKQLLTDYLITNKLIPCTYMSTPITTLLNKEITWVTTIEFLGEKFVGQPNTNKLLAENSAAELVYKDKEKFINDKLGVVLLARSQSFYELIHNTYICIFDLTNSDNTNKVQLPGFALDTNNKFINHSSFYYLVSVNTVIPDEYSELTTIRFYNNDIENKISSIINSVDVHNIFIYSNRYTDLNLKITRTCNVEIIKY